jgi:hypothetical protein
MENIANTAKIDQIKNYFNIYIDELGKQHFDYHPEFLGYKHFLENRLKYTVESVRQACSTNKKICLVTNYRYVDKILENWKKLDTKIKPLKDFYPKIRTIDNPNLKDFVKRTFEDDLYSDNFLIDSDTMTYVDFIEKLVLIDYFFENFINDNFVKYQSFPYSGKHTHAWMSGFCNLFNMWPHYNKTCREKLNQNFLIDKDYSDHLNQFNYIDTSDDEEEGEDEEELSRQEKMEEQAKKFEEQLENPASQDIMKELNAKKGLNADTIIDNRNPFKSIKRKK